MTKKDYIEFARSLGWTKADAERAYHSGLGTFDLAQAGEVEILTSLARFAGRELVERQRLQAAQKSQATLNRRRREDLETVMMDKDQAYQQALAEERSRWQNLVARLYQKLQKLGVSVAWIEEYISR
jgi:hypothetical protein